MSTNPDSTLQRADLRIDPEWIIPIQPAGLTLQAHSVLVRDGRIVALVPRSEADALWRADVVQHLPGQLLMPGLVNLHCHAAMSLMRGLADDLPLMNWLQQHIWPLLENGRIKPVIYQRFPLADAPAAHALMESSQHIGKILLTC